MSNLVPEKRLDSNGHLVTRWIKPESYKTSAPLPAPIAVSYSDSSKVLRALKETFRYQPITIPSNTDMCLVEQRLDALSPSTTKFLREYFDEDPHDCYFSALLISALENRVPATAVDDIAYVYSTLDDTYEGGDLSTEIEWGLKGFVPEFILRGSLSGISKMNIDGVGYEYGGSTPLRELDDETVSKVMAVYYAASLFDSDQSLYGQPIRYDIDGSAIFTKPGLGEYIANNHHRIKDVLEAMEARKSCDPSVIDEALSMDSKPMWSGVL